MKKNLHGITLSIFIGIIALIIAGFLPIGAVALAIIIGAVIGNTVSINEKYNPGITYAEKSLLAWAIAFMGINLDFTILAQLGFSSLILIILGMIITIYSAVLIAKKMGFDKDFAIILGVGNGVCGSAAIAATKDIVGLDKQKTGLAVAIVNFLGTIGIFILPLVAVFILQFDDVEAGILIGNTLQAVGHVVAGGFSISESAGQSATIVKMARVLMLTFVVLALIYYVSKHKVTVDQQTSKSSVPLFIWGFIGFAILATINILPTFIYETISLASKYLLIVAMAAIGLKISFKAIKEQGGEALKLASFVFLIQVLFTTLFIVVLF